MNRLGRAIFFDRDGVINKERLDYVKNTQELEILPNVAGLIKKLKEAGFKIVVVTNQSAINRGLTTHENVKNIHLEIQQYLIKNGTKIDGFYYCPHKPDEGCECRKPKPGLLLKAADELKVDLKSSWMIGDNNSDVQAAASVGCNAIKVARDFGFEKAVREILEKSRSKTD